MFVHIPKSFITNILHQFFEHKIKFVNSQHAHTNLEGYFVLKNRFLTLLQKFLMNKYKSKSDLVRRIQLMRISV